MLKKAYNPRIKEALVHFSQSVSLVYDHLRAEADRFLKEFSSKPSGHPGIVLRIKKLLGIHPALRREVMRLAIQQQLGHLRRLNFTHIESIEELIRHQPCGARISLPYGVSVQKRKSLLMITAVQKRPLKKQKKPL